MSRLIGRHRKASVADKKAAEVKPVVEKKLEDKKELKEDKKVTKQSKKDK